MARIRTIKPDLAFDHELAMLPLEVQKFYILLWTHADKAGRGEDDPLKLRALIFPYHPKLDGNEILGRLHPKFVFRYQHDGKRYFEVQNWPKHQRPPTSEVESVIPPPKDVRKHFVTSENVKKHFMTSYKGKEWKGREGKGLRGETAPRNAPEAIKPINGNGAAEQAVFRSFMDGVLRDYYGKFPGDPDPGRRKAVTQAYARFARAGTYILTAAEGDPALARSCVDDVVARMKAWDKPCQLDTVAKWADEYFANPEAFRDGTKKETARRS